MATPKKTIRVAPLARRLQRTIEVVDETIDDPDIADAVRRYAGSILEYILVETDNYKGFNYVDRQGNATSDYNGDDGRNESRRRYYGLTSL